MRVPRREHAHIPAKGGAGCPPRSALTQYRRLISDGRSRNPNGGSFARPSRFLVDNQHVTPGFPLHFIGHAQAEDATEEPLVV